MLTLPLKAHQTLYITITIAQLHWLVRSRSMRRTASRGVHFYRLPDGTFVGRNRHRWWR